MLPGLSFLPRASALAGNETAMATPSCVSSSRSSAPTWGTELDYVGNDFVIAPDAESRQQLVQCPIPGQQVGQRIATDLHVGFGAQSVPRREQLRPNKEKPALRPDFP